MIHHWLLIRWLEKNKDPLNDSVVDVMKNAPNQTLPIVFKVIFLHLFLNTVVERIYKVNIFFLTFPFSRTSPATLWRRNKSLARKRRVAARRLTHFLWSLKSLEIFGNSTSINKAVVDILIQKWRMLNNQLQFFMNDQTCICQRYQYVSQMSWKWYKKIYLKYFETQP